MPIYSYKCTNCGKIFEKFEKADSGNKVFCSDCNSETLRIFSPVGIVFKGKGFYSTDYSSKSSKAAVEKPISDKAEPSKPKEEAAKSEQKKDIKEKSSKDK